MVMAGQRGLPWASGDLDRSPRGGWVHGCTGSGCAVACSGVRCPLGRGPGAEGGPCSGAVSVGWASALGAALTVVSRVGRAAALPGAVAVCGGPAGAWPPGVERPGGARGAPWVGASAAACGSAAMSSCWASVRSLRSCSSAEVCGGASRLASAACRAEAHVVPAIMQPGGRPLRPAAQLFSGLQVWAHRGKPAPWIRLR